MRLRLHCGCLPIVHCATKSNYLLEFYSKLEVLSLMQKALFRNGSNRMETWAGDKQEAGEETKKVVVKVVPSHQEESLKQFPLTNKSAIAVQSSAIRHAIVNSREGHERFNRFHVIRPSSVLLIFATTSCMGTIILIYFTLAAGRSGGV